MRSISFSLMSRILRKKHQLASEGRKGALFKFIPRQLINMSSSELSSIMSIIEDEESKPTLDTSYDIVVKNQYFSLGKYMEELLTGKGVYVYKYPPLRTKKEREKLKEEIQNHDRSAIFISQKMASEADKNMNIHIKKNRKMAIMGEIVTIKDLMSGSMKLDVGLNRIENDTEYKGIADAILEIDNKSAIIDFKTFSEYNLRRFGSIRALMANNGYQYQLAMYSWLNNDKKQYEYNYIITLPELKVIKFKLDVYMKDLVRMTNRMQGYRTK